MSATRHWSGRWWGGALADGTVIVTNPAFPVESIVDYTATTATRDTMYQAPPTNLREWLGHRVTSLGRLPLGLPLAPMRSSLILAMGSAVLTTVLVITLAPGPTWMAAIMVAGAALGALLVLANERRAVDTDTLVPVAETDHSPLSPLRYVDPQVVAMRAWERIEAVAERLGPRSPESATVHQTLWAAAGVHASMDEGILEPVARVDLELLATQAEDLLVGRERSVS